MATSPPSEGQVRAALERVLASPGFAGAGRLGPFLRHLVECTLAGERDRLKESVLGVEVFQRPADYDPRTDPIVRVEARRLRQRLDDYYSGQGKRDASVRIDLPKGGYVPDFQPAQTAGRPWWHYAAGIAGLACIGIPLGYWQSRSMSRLRHAPIALMAVLPFENVGGDPANEPFSDGLTEELMERLSRTPGVKVIARSVMFQYKGQRPDVRKVAVEVDASMVVEGTVRRSGSRVRVTARLTNPRDGVSMWSQTYEREMKDIFAIQDDIAQSIANALRIRMNAPPTRHAQNLDAYNAVLNGRYQMNLYSRDGLLLAIRYFEDAIQLDGDYAAAHAGLSRAYAMLGFYNGFAQGQSWADARREAERAIALDGSLAEANVALGIVLALHEWRWREAEAELRKAIELDDTSAQAHGFYAITVLLPEARLDEAAKEFRRALELDPLDSFVNYLAGFGLIAAGNYEAAVRQYKRTLELKTIHPNMYWDLGMALGFLKRYDEARAAIREARRLRGDDPDQPGGLDLYFAGDEAGARRSAPGVQQWAESGHLEFMNVARMWAVLGEKQRALDALEKSVARHESDAAFLRVDPRLRGLKDEPRMQALERKIGLLN